MVLYGCDLTKKKKLYKRILAKPKDLRFEELEKVLIDCGYVCDHIKGSHAVFIKQGSVTLTIPVKTPVKSYLINQVLVAVEDCFEDEA